MRLVPCMGNCKDGYASLPDGKPYICGRTPSFPFRVKCGRCKAIFSLTAPQWNRLPRLTPERLAQLSSKGNDLIDIYTRDLRGSGLADDQALDMLKAGIHSPSDPALAPDEKRRTGVA